MGLLTEEISSIVARLVRVVQLRYNSITQMLKCSHCGGRLRRVHRTFSERFRFAAIYYCKECDSQRFVPRLFQYHFGPYSRCPRCGSYRLTKLKEPDKIDRMHRGLLNLLEKIYGGCVFHCRYCRIQFYDRRSRAPEGVEDQPYRRVTPAHPREAREDA